MKCLLNDKKIASLKTEKKREEFWDTSLPSFGIRVTKTGYKTFFVMCRTKGAQKRITLGHYPIISLSEARELAREKMRLVSDGMLIEEPEAQTLTVNEAFDLFIEIYAKEKNKDWKCAENRLRGTFIKEYGAVDIRDITRQDIIRLLDNMMARKTPIQANRVLAGIAKFLKWCAERGYIETSPAIYIAKPAKENPRDRVLSDDELYKIWVQTEKMGYPFGNILQILILTGQRKSEVAEMRWGELDLKNKVWVIPKERSKNGNSHSVPLTQPVIDILESVPRFLHSEFVFTTTGRSPVSGFGKTKKRLDTVTGISDWIIHDLRRTAASGMARLKVPPHVVEKVLNHISGTFSSVTGVYNRYGYEDEKRDALETWNSFIKELIYARERISHTIRNI